MKLQDPFKKEKKEKGEELKQNKKRGRLPNNKPNRKKQR
jgi:hypothetical protein